MRILSLRIKNINSLRGDWLLDLTHPAYALNGLFAITGPTGAGKSTILDCICLALYGRTPRIDSITKQSCEVMTRGTGECECVLTFSVNQSTYRANWYQNRARCRSDGNLQDSKVELCVSTKSGQWRILASQKRAFDKSITQIIGLGFEQFTRSILLAQGSFAAFLSSTAESRSETLEKITGTSIYSEISRQVQKRYSEENKQLETVKLELSFQAPFSAEERAQKEALAADLTVQAQNAGREISRLSEAKNWLETLRSLAQRRSALQQTHAQLEAREALLAAHRARLEAARRAARLAGDVSQLAQLRSRIEQARAAAAGLEQQDQILQAHCTRVQAERTRAQRELMDAQQKRQTLQPLLNAVIVLDAQIQDQSKRLAPLQQSFAEARDELARATQQAAQQQRSLETLADRIRQNASWLADHARDASLVQEIGFFTHDEDTLQRLKRQLEQQQKDAAQAQQTVLSRQNQTQTARNALEQARTECEQAGIAIKKQQLVRDALLNNIPDLHLLRQQEQALSERLFRLEQARTGIDQVLGERRALEQIQAQHHKYSLTCTSLQSRLDAAQTQLDCLEKTRADLDQWIQFLDRHNRLALERAQLRDNTACPLCGALEHPYSVTDAPKLSDKSDQRQTCLTAIDQVKKQIKTLTDQLSQARTLASSAVLSIETQNPLLQTRTNTLVQLLVSLGLPQSLDDSAALQDEVTGSTDRRARLRQTIESVEASDRELSKLQTRLSALETAHRLAALSCSRLEGELARDQQCFEQRDQAREQTRQSIEQNRLELGRQLSAYLSELPEAVELAVPDLRVRAQTYEQQAQTFESLSAEQALGQKDLEHSRLNMQALNTQTEQLKTDCDTLTATLLQLSSKRSACFGEKDPRQEQARSQQEEQEKQTALNTAQNAEQQTLQEHTSVLAQLKTTQEGLNKDMRAQLALEGALAVRLTDQGFADQQAWSAAYMPQTDYDALKAKLRQADDERKDNSAALSELEQQLAAEQNKALTNDPLERILELLVLAGTHQQQVHEDLGKATAQLEADDQKRQSQLQVLTRLQQRKKELDLWQLLNEMIGSSDGKKYRTFVQSLAFESLVALANEALCRMSPRYALVCDETERLELNVIDSYQAGEIRPTKTLSGGESFLVSLALALGLSRLASKNVQIDTLFLDEGFGTLDEDALDNALTALAGLNSQGKLIGIISHVGQIKDRLTTQIEVIPQSGGVSRLAGPGITQNPHPSEPA